MMLKLKLVTQTLLATITRRILGSHVCELIVKTDNGLFAIGPDDYAVGRQLRMTGKYGLDEIERLRQYVKPDSRVLIAGAHVGTLAIPISKICRDVVAIEANPNTYELLEMNVALNAASNCQAINIAASDKEGNIEFLLNRVNSGGSKRVPETMAYMYYYDNPKRMTLKAVSLDKYLDRRDFDIVVMDIEGSEYFALKGMQEILSNCEVLIVEFVPHHLRNVSSVSVEQFLSVIEPHFSRLTIPSKQLVLGATEFVSCLSEMYNHNQEDDGIIFEKV